MQTQADVAHIVDSALLTQGAALDNDARLLTHVAILEAIRRWSSGALGLDAVGVELLARLGADSEQAEAFVTKVLFTIPERSKIDCVLRLAQLIVVSLRDNPVGAAYGWLKKSAHGHGSSALSPVLPVRCDRC